jgi:cytoskeletal protein CcmA (bactofilin family)
VFFRNLLHLLHTCDIQFGQRPKDISPAALARRAAEIQKGRQRMLHSSENQKSPNSSIPTSFPHLNTVSSPVEQATIGRSLVIKGEVSGAESLYIDGRIEGSVSVPDHRVTIGRNGTVSANISAKEVVIMGKVKGNIQCSDRLDIRGEGSLTGDVVTQRISVEDGAVLKGSVQVRAAESKTSEARNEKANGLAKGPEAAKPAEQQPKAAVATA